MATLHLFIPYNEADHPDHSIQGATMVLVIVVCDTRVPSRFPVLKLGLLSTKIPNNMHQKQSTSLQIQIQTTEMSICSEDEKPTTMTEGDP